MAKKYPDVVEKARVIDLNPSSEVAIANNMIVNSASKLTLNELKFLRFIIMQCKKGDQEFFELDVEVKDFADMVGVDKKDIYRDLKKMAKHLMSEVIEIGDNSKKQWLMFHWVDVCQYNKGKVRIKISDELRPYLLALHGNFTRYQLEEILHFNSVYAIRIYEIINSYMDDRNLPYADHAVEVDIAIDTIRRATNTTDKYERYSNFKEKVIDIAVKDINRMSKFHVTATPYKSGKKVEGFTFLVESEVGFRVRTGSVVNDIMGEPEQLTLDFKQ